MIFVLGLSLVIMSKAFGIIYNVMGIHIVSQWGLSELEILTMCQGT